MIPGAGSSLGTAPTGPSAGRRAPGRDVEPAPVSPGACTPPPPDPDPDPYPLDPPAGNGEPPPPPVPGEPDIPTGRTAMTPRAGRAGPPPPVPPPVERVGSRVPDGASRPPALGHPFEAEAASTARAGGNTHEPVRASASDRPPSRRWRVLVDEDMQWKLDPRRVTVVQVAGGAL
jgi:hypothetical protein